MFSKKKLPEPWKFYTILDDVDGDILQVWTSSSVTLRLPSQDSETDWNEELCLKNNLLN